ncbi:MAG: DUF3788 family protein [Bacteroidetes bacterium]|nr:DUF3788 family protein [Bacteroidota bacterium]
MMEERSDELNTPEDAQPDSDQAGEDVSGDDASREARPEKQRRYKREIRPSREAASAQENDGDDPSREVRPARDVHPDAERVEQGIARLPFNDFKHPPTRPEIDLLLGISPSAELKRFEHQLEMMEPLVNWAMQWYENETGWGYRASYRARVLCVLHFYRGFFTVTLSIPTDEEERYRSLRELTPGLRKAFEHYTLSTKMKWINFHVRTRKEADAMLAILTLKFEDLRKKTSRG